jgi:hypothetical protein
MKLPDNFQMRERGNNSKLKIFLLFVFTANIYILIFHKRTKYDNVPFKYGWYTIVIWNRHGLECTRIWKLSGNFIKKCRDFLGRDIKNFFLVNVLEYRNLVLLYSAGFILQLCINHIWTEHCHILSFYEKWECKYLPWKQTIKIFLT